MKVVTKKKMIKAMGFCLLVAMALASFPGCSSKKAQSYVKIDGSSTVFPITEAIAEEYRQVKPDIRVTVGVSGTGGGFKKFLANEIDINNASRSIKSTEIKMAKERNIRYLELPVAYDGITVIVNKDNDWAHSITPAELKKIWEPGSQVKLWSEVREGWPEKKIELFGPGTDSGTFDYFTKAINGREHVSRKNYTMSEDDNVLVTGVSGNKYALGYIGFAYYYENMKKLKVVAIGEGDQAVTPTIETINNGSYKPLSRPIFIYVSQKASTRPEVRSFVNFYLDTAPKVVKKVGYVPLPGSEYAKAKSNLIRFVK